MATQPIHSLTDTWTVSGTTYTAIGMDVTDSASAAASRLLALQVGSTDKFVVDKNGAVTVGSWTATEIAVASGGTGQTTYTDGQLLIGNTTGNTLAKATLTGTANQVVVTNGSGTITLSTPQSIGTGSSPTFAAMTLTSPLSLPDGTVGAPSLTNTGDTDTGIYFSADNTVSIAAAGVLQASISNSLVDVRQRFVRLNNRNTGSNWQEFRVYRTDDGAGNHAYFEIIGTATTNTMALRGINAGTAGVVRLEYRATKHTFRDDTNANLLVIDNGDLDMTHTGNAEMTITNTTSSMATFFGVGSTWAYVGTSSNHTFMLRTNATTRMALDNNGGIGIGNGGTSGSNLDRVIQFQQITGSDPTNGTDRACIYAKDVSGTAEMFAMDEAETATQLSAHMDAGDLLAAGITVDPDDALPFVTHHTNRHIGIRYITYRNPFDGTVQTAEIFLPADEITDWDTEEQKHKQQRDAEIALWQEAKDAAEAQGETFDEVKPEEYIVRQEPAMITRGKQIVARRRNR